MDLKTHSSNFFNQSYSSKKPENGSGTFSNSKSKRKEIQEPFLMQRIETLNNQEETDKYTNLFNGCISPTLSIRKYIESSSKTNQKNQFNSQNNGKKLYFNSIVIDQRSSKNSIFNQHTESTMEDRLPTDFYSKKQEEKTHSVKANKVMKTIDDLYKTLKISRDRTPVYKSNRPVFKANVTSLKFDLNDYNLSSPTKIKKSQVKVSNLMKDKSKSKERYLGDILDKEKKEDSFIQFIKGMKRLKLEFDNSKKVNRKSLLK